MAALQRDARRPPQIESTERELAQARELQRRLRLDVERLSAPRRIEQLALRAHMVRADRATTRIIVRPAAAVRR